MTKKTHVVIGAGASGLALTRTLLQKDDVILVSEGSWPEDYCGSFMAKNIIDCATNSIPTAHAWTFRAFNEALANTFCTTSQQFLYGRSVLYSRGKVFGGSGSVNAMIYTLGTPNVFDKFWPQNWNSELILKSATGIFSYFTPLMVTTNGQLQGLFKQSVFTRKSGELFDNQAINGAYYASISSDNTARLSQPQVSLNSALEVGKLTVLSNYVVEKITFKGRTAHGVQIHCCKPKLSGQVNNIKYVCPSNGGEIIVCAGAFETPRILIDSGLKNHSETEAAANEPQLPNVNDIGAHLQDHVTLPFMLWGNWSDGWSTKKSGLFQSFHNQYPLNGVHGWVNLTSEGNIWNSSSELPPCAQLLVLDGRVAAGCLHLLLPNFVANQDSSWFLKAYVNVLRPILAYIMQWLANRWIVRWLCGGLFAVLVCLTQPKSRGRLLEGQKRKAGDPLLVDPNYLSEPQDMLVLFNGLKTARRLVSDARTRDGGLRSMELLPGPLFRNADTLEGFRQFAGMFANTYFHACGTCRMEDSTTGQSGVVDDQLRVKGVHQLRVADASVIPHIPSGPTHATCMVIGDTCGQLINNMN